MPEPTLPESEMPIPTNSEAPSTSMMHLDIPLSEKVEVTPQNDPEQNTNPLTEAEAKPFDRAKTEKEAREALNAFLTKKENRIAIRAAMSVSTLIGTISNGTIGKNPETEKGIDWFRKQALKKSNNEINAINSAKCEMTLNSIHSHYESQLSSGTHAARGTLVSFYLENDRKCTILVLDGELSENRFFDMDSDLRRKFMIHNGEKRWRKVHKENSVAIRRGEKPKPLSEELSILALVTQNLNGGLKTVEVVAYRDPDPHLFSEKPPEELPEELLKKPRLDDNQINSYLTNHPESLL